MNNSQMDMFASALATIHGTLLAIESKLDAHMKQAGHALPAPTVTAVDVKAAAPIDYRNPPTRGAGKRRGR